PGRPHQCDGDHEATQFVYRRQRLPDRCVSWHVQLIGVTQNGLDHIFGDTALAQNWRAVLRVPVECWMHLEVKIVNKADEPPELLILAKDTRVLAHTSFNGKAVPDERVSLHILGEKLPGIVSCDLHCHWLAFSIS